MTVDEALAAIRQHGIGERIIYFYVVDTEGRLAGVLPTRRLLSATSESKLGDLMVRRVVTVPETASLLDALELFVLYKFFAFPVIDAGRKVVGVIDISSFTEEVMDFTEPEKVNDMFETLGFHITQIAGLRPTRHSGSASRGCSPPLPAAPLERCSPASSKRRSRGPLSSRFSSPGAGAGRGRELQSMTLTLQALRATQPTWKWFWDNARREIVTAVMIGLGCGGSFLASSGSGAERHWPRA